MHVDFAFLPPIAVAAGFLLALGWGVRESLRDDDAEFQAWNFGGSHVLRILFCKHKRQAWVRNIHGDEINQSGGRRSIWFCQDCHVIQLHRELHDSSQIHAVGGSR